MPAFGRALNLAGGLRLTAAQLDAATAGPGRITELAADRVDRPDGLSGEEPQDTLTVLLGDAGSGRSTELAALAVRRAGAAEPLPTLWLRGADLAPGDGSLDDALRRRLAAAAHRSGLPEASPAELAERCADGGRPLLVVLDGPEEAPLALSAAWLAAGLEWLRAHRARALVACRPDGWEQLGPWRTAARALWLGPLTDDAAARAARRYGLPEGFLGPAERGHPLALRLAGDLRAAGVHGPVADRAELFDGWLDLACLTVARRVAQASGGQRRHRRGGPVPTGEDARQVRRLAAVAAGRLHEAARLMLGAGDGRCPPRSSTGCSRPRAAGRGPSARSTCWSRRVPATGPATRRGGSGCRACTWTSARRCASCSPRTAGRPAPPGPGPPGWRRCPRRRSRPPRA
ncbi:hypothetical protein KCH_53090 [Kitasatospora cheerisanensis KCTC 2395]|uniref:Uncharacterized protein n=1 Tax=Kitasatospora cheerisanensis KCTC 2395 TaxID=1348663 RepID=A0A066YSI5_9ACTN|nr:hypothetical protein KCH_53090 [Kitasatospora cheerisanensis KCTC 2395]